MKKPAVPDHAPASKNPKRAVASATVRGCPCPEPQLGPAIVAWFRNNARALPWRTAPRNPWAVWVSEVMLQQTRVTTVIPYFQRFMQRWPDARSLAVSELDELLGTWSGLGYYRRARALHAGAKAVAEMNGGAIPGTFRELKGLPGVGDYTAAAIASLAFGEAVAVVDGNVRRVVARLFALRGSLDDAAGKAKISLLANRMLAGSPPGAFNEAMMELGALVCTPTSPQCLTCPASAWCEARRQGLQDVLPEKIDRAEPKTIHATAVVLIHGKSVLMARRKPDGLFGGLWEPLVVGRPVSARERQMLCKLAGAAVNCGPDQCAGRVRHVLTHRVMELDVIRAVANRSSHEPTELPPEYDRLRWFGTHEIAALGLSTLARRVLKTAGVQAQDQAPSPSGRGPTSS